MHNEHFFHLFQAKLRIKKKESYFKITISRAISEPNCINDMNKFVTCLLE